MATLDHFKGYVWGPKFLVRTDHAALVWLKNLKNIQGMLARWLAKLQQFNFDIVHRPGAQHGNADGLSQKEPILRQRRFCGEIAQQQGRARNW